MAKYIDKDEVVDMLRRWGQEAAETNSSEAAAFEAVAYELQYFPEDDMVPVVRLLSRAGHVFVHPGNDGTGGAGH